MTKPPPFLPFFVYGTLLPGQDNDHYWGGRIEQQVEGRLRGAELYSFDYFPMLIRHPDPQKVVKGMILTVDQTIYPKLLQGLDRLEEYDPADEANSIYHRRPLQVETDRGTSCTAWVYVGQPALVAGRPLITGGDWRQVTTANPFTAWWETNGSRLMSGLKSNSDS